MIQILSLLLMDCAFVAHLVVSARPLPDRIASHFQPGGQADGWVSRRAYLAIMTLMGPGLSLVWMGLVLALRNHPARFVGQHAAWAGCLVLGFIFGIHILTVKANQAAARQLPMNLFWGLFGTFQLGLIVWLLTWPKLSLPQRQPNCEISD
jgi:hypothetical protein